MDLSRVHPAIPFSVDINKLSKEEFDQYLDALENQFGGEYFRGRDLFLEVIDDLETQAAQKKHFDGGPHVGLSVGRSGELKIHCHKYRPGSDMAVYAYDQIMAWSKHPETFVSKALRGKELNYSSKFDTSPSP